MNPDAQSWCNNAQSDFEAAKYLFNGAKYPQALYYLFQALEKLLKATQMEKTNTDPKKIHRLETLAKESGLSFSEEQLNQLTQLSKHYGRIRYSDYAQTKYNTIAKTEPIFTLGKDLFVWIHTQLSNH